MGGISVNEAVELIEKLTRERFYGTVTIKFEAGRVVLIKKEETFKPNDLSEKPRSHYEAAQDQ